MAKTAQLIVLTMLHHIKQHHHPLPATAREISKSSGRHQSPLLARLRKLARAGWLNTQKRRFDHPDCISYEASVFWLSEAGLTLLRDSEHLMNKVEILEPKQSATNRSQFARVSSVFDLGSRI